MLDGFLINEDDPLLLDGDVCVPEPPYYIYLKKTKVEVKRQ